MLLDDGDGRAVSHQAAPPAQVYDFAITPDGAGVPGANGASVIFRFMPDAKEVQSALEVRPAARPACSAGRSGSAPVRVVLCARLGKRGAIAALRHVESLRTCAARSVLP